MSDDGKPEAVVIGGSAGSLEALSLILPALPVDFPIPVLIVIHLPADKENMLPVVLQAKCPIAICEARDKEPIKAGTVYFAPPDYHLLVETDRFLSLSCDDPQLFSRPSIDVLFESAADVYGPGLIGIILSGANEDGARGLEAVAEEGGVTLVQSPDRAYADTMPIAALKKCVDAQSLDPSGIARFLRRKCDYADP